MIRYMLIMDSLETYDIHLYSITTCIHAIGYEINVNTKSSMTFEKGAAAIAALLLQEYTDVLSKVTLFNK
jgi:hypothetical protein